MGSLLPLRDVFKFIEGVFGSGMHAKRVNSMGTAVYGLMFSSRLCSSGVGRSLALATGKSPKHCIKQMDRLFGNENFNVTDAFTQFVPLVVGPRKEIVVSLDWTEYGLMKQSRIAVNLITSHGRATPLIWKTYNDSAIKNHRGKYERKVLEALREKVGEGTHVTVLADRGFADTSFFEFIQGHLGWDYCIRFVRSMWVTTSDGERRKAHEWVPQNGRTKELDNAVLTDKQKYVVPKMLFLKQRGMKEAWLLATSRKDDNEKCVKLYGRRFTCEENFRDEKDDRFGLGAKESRVSTPERRDRMTLLFALAAVLLTIVGASGEKIKYDRMLRANTSRKRTHSLFRQGREYIRGVIESYVEVFRREIKHLLDNHGTNVCQASLI
jgi:hypothetical protein